MRLFFSHWTKRRLDMPILYAHSCGFGHELGLRIALGFRFGIGNCWNELPLLSPRL
jgi:hypothetical protein